MKLAKTCLNLIILIVVGIGVTGCAKTIYSWGDYPDQVYAYFSDKPLGELINSLEKHRQGAAGKKEALPPSFYAHLGMLYQKNGDVSKFKEMLLIEKKRFPESTGMVDFLLKRID